MANGNQFAPDGTLTRFKFMGPNSQLEHPITKQLFDIKPEDTLLYEGIPNAPSVSDNPLIRFASNDLTIHRIFSTCPRCTRPVREHLLVDTSSILACRCGNVEST
jgi:hypothetical protein